MLIANAPSSADRRDSFATRVSRKIQQSIQGSLGDFRRAFYFSSRLSTGAFACSRVRGRSLKGQRSHVLILKTLMSCLPTMYVHAARPRMHTSFLKRRGIETKQTRSVHRCVQEVYEYLPIYCELLQGYEIKARLHQRYFKRDLKCLSLFI